MVLIGGLERKRLTEAGQRLRTLVERSSVPAVPGLEVTVSVGITEARSDDTVASLVARADTRMYEAKKLGRNRVVDDAVATS